jgi:hypothetical protein
MGYKFQFVTLAGFHSLNLSMIGLARGYRERGTAAYAELQQAEFAAEAAAHMRDASPARSACRVVRCSGDCHFGWTKAATKSPPSCNGGEGEREDHNTCSPRCWRIGSKSRSSCNRVWPFSMQWWRLSDQACCEP